MSESNVLISDDSAEDMRSAITILETIRFQVGSELLRKDIKKAIQHLKHGLATSDACSQALSLLKGEKEFEEDLTLYGPGGMNVVRIERVITRVR